MISKRFIGFKTKQHSADVEKGRLLFFAKATGQKDPIYLDEDAARKAGFHALPAPPTFVFSLELEKPDPFDFLSEMKIDLGRVLHGEQGFIYHQPICAGDRITFASHIEDIYDKKDGALEFIIQKTTATNQMGDIVAEMTRTIVVRN